MKVAFKRITSPSNVAPRLSCMPMRPQSMLSGATRIRELTGSKVTPGLMTSVDYTCLLIEDSPMMRQLLVFALARVKNLPVTEADDGSSG